MKVENITKAATFKSFLLLNYKKNKITFFVTVLLYIFMQKYINQWFLGATQKYELRVSFKVFFGILHKWEESFYSK